MKKFNYLFAVVFVLSGILFPSLPATAAQKALLIGIGTYKNLPYTNSKGDKLDNLRGPVNDVQKIKELLVSSYNFSPDNILTLEDQGATREAILSSFNQWLIKGTKPGDLVLFYFSGHGTRISRGTQGFYKAICPHDALLKAKDVQSAKLILDDELGDLLNKLKGREVVVIVDSCHSGGMTRSIRGVSAIQLEETPAVQVKFLPVEIEDLGGSVKTRGVGLSNASPRTYDGAGDRISFASSREDQTSVELAFSSGIVHGAFTAALLEGIEKKKNISYGEWFDQAKKTIKDKFRLEQDPQLKTNKGKLVTYSVFKPNPPVSVSPGLTAKNFQTTPQTASASPFIEEKEVKVLVRLDPIAGLSHETLETFKKGLMEIPHVDLVDTAFFDYLIRGEFKNNQFRIRLVTPMGDGEKIQPSGNLNILTKRITPFLEYAYLLKKLSRISNPNPTFKVNVQLKDKERRDFKVGEKARFIVSSDKDCYLVILNLDSQGGLRILFPNEYFKNNFIKAGQVIKIPDEKMGKKFELEFGEPIGEEVVKVIATEKPLKLENLGLAKLENLGKAKPDFANLNLGYFGPKGMIEVPEGTRGIVVKKVEGLRDENIVWSEDTIVIRTHK